MEEIYNELLKIINKENIFLNEPMCKHTTFKIGGPADIFVKACNVEELTSILKICKSKNVPITVIGNGSNVLVMDRRNTRNNCEAMF